MNTSFCVKGIERFIVCEERLLSSGPTGYAFLLAGPKSWLPASRTGISMYSFCAYIKASPGKLNQPFTSSWRCVRKVRPEHQKIFQWHSRKTKANWRFPRNYVMFGWAISKQPSALIYILQCDWFLSVKFEFFHFRTPRK